MEIERLKQPRFLQRDRLLQDCLRPGASEYPITREYPLLLANSSCTASFGIVDPTQEAQHVVLRHADDLVRDRAVRRAMQRREVVRPCGAGEAEGSSALRIEPVGQELDAEVVCHLEITRVVLRDLFGGRTGELMAIHEERHRGTVHDGPSVVQPSPDRRQSGPMSR